MWYFFFNLTFRGMLEYRRIGVDAKEYPICASVGKSGLRLLLKRAGRNVERLGGSRVGAVDAKIHRKRRENMHRDLIFA